MIRRVLLAGGATLGLSFALRADGHAGIHAAPAVLTPEASSAVAGDSALGARIFVGFNCADCHGAGGSGAMAPALNDNRWKFGGSPAEIARSITEGRPEGMPAWGPMLGPAQVRALVAYLGSLGAGRDVTTENFTGATVERAGH